MPVYCNGKLLLESPVGLTFQEFYKLVVPSRKKKPYLEEVELAKLFGIHKNYLKHIREQGMAPPDSIELEGVILYPRHSIIEWFFNLHPNSIRCVYPHRHKMEFLFPD